MGVFSRLVAISALSLSMLLPSSFVSAQARTLVTPQAACNQLNSALGWSISPITTAAVPANFCVSVFASVPSFGNPRGLLYLKNTGSLIAAHSATATLHWYNDRNRNGVIDVSQGEQVQLAAATGLNHGVALWRAAGASAGWLLASSDTTVYAWPFDEGVFPPTGLANRRTLIQNLPGGGHSTRTLIVSGDGTGQWLYVSVGSCCNIDTNIADKSLIRRFDLTRLNGDAASFTPYNYNDGVTIASGLRNEVGLEFDKYGQLWGVENGADNANRADIGGDVHMDNPGEELNKFDVTTNSNVYYGYPYCISEFKLAASVARGPGAQWAWGDFMNDGTHNDAWCRDTSKNKPPQLSMQAHSAPLGITFYPTQQSTPPGMPSFAFPAAEYAGVAIIPFHGSWNRDPATGYKVVTVSTTDSGSSIDVTSGATAQDFFKFNDPTLATGNGWPYRPVDVAVGNQGELYISDDAGRNILVVRYVDTTQMTTAPPGTPSAGAFTTHTPPPDATTSPPITTPASGSQRAVSFPSFSTMMIAVAALQLSALIVGACALL